MADCPNWMYVPDHVECPHHGVGKACLDCVREALAADCPNCEKMREALEADHDIVHDGFGGFECVKDCQACKLKAAALSLAPATPNATHNHDADECVVKNCTEGHPPASAEPCKCHECTPRVPGPPNTPSCAHGQPLHAVSGGMQVRCVECGGIPKPAHQSAAPAKEKSNG